MAEAAETADVYAVLDANRPREKEAEMHSSIEGWIKAAIHPPPSGGGMMHCCGMRVRKPFCVEIIRQQG